MGGAQGAATTHTHSLLNLGTTPSSSQVFILEELLSPIVTPLILIFCLRPRALEIIDFFRNFTVEVVGVGDTCSFAQMDVRQHGHPQVEGTLGEELGQRNRCHAGPDRTLETPVLCICPNLHSLKNCFVYFFEHIQLCSRLIPSLHSGIIPGRLRGP